MIISSKLIRQCAEELRVWCIIHKEECESCDFYTGAGCCLRTSQAKIADRIFPWEKAEKEENRLSELKRNIEIVWNNMRAAEDYEIALEGIKDTQTGYVDLDSLIEDLNEAQDSEEFLNTLSKIYDRLP